MMHTLKEESENISMYIRGYLYIINHDALKILLNLILKVHNFLNKNSGKKEEKNFDIRNITNIINLKNNNKQFFEILLKLYFSNSDKHITRSDLHILNTVIESDQLPLSESDLSKHITLLNTIKENITTLSINKHFQSSLEQIFSNIAQTLSNLKSDIESEIRHRKQLLEYFSYTADSSKPEIIPQIFSNCYTLLSKIATIPRTSNPIHKQSSPIAQKKIKNKENNKRASNLINKYNLN